MNVTHTRKAAVPVRRALLEQTYQPNVGDARVRKRILKVIDWASTMLHPTKERPYHHTALAEVFGSWSNPLSIYLRAQVLIQRGRYQAGVKSFDYVQNVEGLEKLRVLVGALSSGADVINIRPTECSESSAFAKFDDEIESGDFNYREGQASTRLHHHLQQMPSENKETFWTARGFNFNYDVEACAPTLLYQLALRHGMHPIALGAIREYVADRRVLRRHIMDLVACTEDIAKRIITAIFNGAQLAANRFCKIFSVYLSGNVSAMWRLQQDPKVNYLRGNVKRMWERIGEASGKNLRYPRDRARVYFALEREVLNAMRKSLREQDIRHFCEHDGFIADQEVDVSNLQAQVKALTGFDIKLSEGWMSKTKNQSVGKGTEAMVITSQHLRKDRVSGTLPSWVSEEHRRCLPSGDPVDSWSAVRRTPG